MSKKISREHQQEQEHPCKPGKLVLLYQEKKSTKFKFSIVPHVSQFVLSIKNPHSGNAKVINYLSVKIVNIVPIIQ